MIFLCAVKNMPMNVYETGYNDQAGRIDFRAARVGHVAESYNLSITDPNVTGISRATGAIYDRSADDL